MLFHRCFDILCAVIPICIFFSIKVIISVIVKAEIVDHLNRIIRHLYNFSIWIIASGSFLLDTSISVLVFLIKTYFILFSNIHHSTLNIMYLFAENKINIYSQVNYFKYLYFISTTLKK